MVSLSLAAMFLFLVGLESKKKSTQIKKLERINIKLNKADVYNNLRDLRHLLGGGAAEVLDSLLSLLSALLCLTSSVFCAPVKCFSLSGSSTTMGSPSPSGSTLEPGLSVWKSGIKYHYFHTWTLDCQQSDEISIQLII